MSEPACYLVLLVFALLLGALDAICRARRIKR
jgi:hypothetical protein